MRLERNDRTYYWSGGVICLVLLCLSLGSSWAGVTAGKASANSLIRQTTSQWETLFVPKTADKIVDPNQTSVGSQAHKRKTKPIAVLRINGTINERPGLSMMSLTGSVPGASLGEFVEILNKASKDDAISGVLLSIEEPLMSWAQVEELRTALRKLRKTGKKSYAYAETIDQLSYLLASECDEIAMTKTGMLVLMGMSGRAVYFKNLFDMLGIQADYMQMGNYKGAAETYTRTGPSPNEQEQVNRMFDSLYDHLVDSIARSRKIPKEKVAQLIDAGPYMAEEAKEAGLIDRVEYRKNFLEYLENQVGGEIALRIDYGKRGVSAINLESPFGFMGALQQLFSGSPEPRGDAIAVLYIDGPIMSGENGEALFGGNIVGSRTIRMVLAQAKVDDDIKAIVVRIDSPGGSATASDVICQAIKECAKEKPVIVSMGSVAASGGYYIACGAKHIIAQPTTITGSIGVVGGKLTFGGLLDKIGITTYGYQRGKNAQMFTATRPFTPDERVKITAIMQTVYDEFKGRVEAARRIDEKQTKLKGSIDYLAQGKIYSGAQALEVGLVDQLGGLQDAIELAAQKAKIEKYHIRSLPKPKTLIDILEMFVAQAQMPDENPKAKLARLNRLVPSVDFNLLSVVEKFLVQKLFQRAYCMGYLLRQEPVLLIQPYEIVLDR
jgi:protease-4